MRGPRELIAWAEPMLHRNALELGGGEMEDGGDVAGDTPLARLVGCAESATGAWDHPSR